MIFSQQHSVHLLKLLKGLSRGIWLRWTLPHPLKEKWGIKLRRAPKILPVTSLLQLLHVNANTVEPFFWYPSIPRKTAFKHTSFGPLWANTPTSFVSDTFIEGTPIERKIYLYLQVSLAWRFPLHAKILALKRCNIIYLTEGSFRYSLSEKKWDKKT